MREAFFNANFDAAHLARWAGVRLAIYAGVAAASMAAVAIYAGIQTRVSNSPMHASPAVMPVEDAPAAVPEIHPLNPNAISPEIRDDLIAHALHLNMQVVDKNNVIIGTIQSLAPAGSTGKPLAVQIVLEGRMQGLLAVAGSEIVADGAKGKLTLSIDDILNVIQTATAADHSDPSIAKTASLPAYQPLEHGITPLQQWWPPAYFRRP